MVAAHPDRSQSPADMPAQVIGNLAEGMPSLGRVRAHQGQVRGDERLPSSLTSLGHGFRTARLSSILELHGPASLEVHNRF